MSNFPKTCLSVNIWCEVLKAADLYINTLESKNKGYMEKKVKVKDEMLP